MVPPERQRRNEVEGREGWKVLGGGSFHLGLSFRRHSPHSCITRTLTERQRVTHRATAKEQSTTRPTRATLITDLNKIMEFHARRCFRRGLSSISGAGQSWHLIQVGAVTDAVYEDFQSNTFALVAEVGTVAETSLVCDSLEYSCSKSRWWELHGERRSRFAASLCVLRRRPRAQRPEGTSVAVSASADYLAPGHHMNSTGRFALHYSGECVSENEITTLAGMGTF